MDNPFDQFDAPVQQSQGNPFDKFDTVKQQPSAVDNAKQNIRQSTLASLVGAGENAAQNVPLIPQIAAGVNATFGQSSGDTWAEKYKQSLANQEAMAEASKQEQPLAAKTGQAAGLVTSLALPVGKAAQLVKTLGQWAKSSAKISGIYGATTGAAESFDPTQSNFDIAENTTLGGLKGGAQGAVTGAVAGPAALGVAKTLGAAGSGIKTAGSYAAGKIGDLLNKPLDSSVVDLSKPENISNTDIANHLVQQIQNTFENSNKFYSLPQEIAKSESVYAPGVKSYLSSVIDDIKSDQFHEARPLLQKFQSTYDNLPDDGTVPVSTLLDLRKASNANFRPGRFTDKDSVYSGLNNAANGGIDVARQEIPHFDEAMDNADRYYVNAMAIPIKNNPLLHQAFDLEDYHNLKQFNDPNSLAETIAPVTAQKIRKLISNVDSPETYSSLRSLMSDDMGTVFDQKVLQSLNSNNWLKAIKGSMEVKTGNLLGAISNFNKITKLNPEQQAIVDAVKQKNIESIDARASASNANYDNIKSNISADEQAQADAAEEAQMREAEEMANRKLLPPPNRPNFAVSPEGAVDKLPDSQVGEYKFGEGAGIPYEPGEMQEINARTGKYEQMPITSTKGQRAFQQGIKPNYDIKGVQRLALPSPDMPLNPSAIHVPPEQGQISKGYQPMNLNAGDEPQAVLKNIAEGRFKGGAVPNRNEWSIILNKTKKLGKSFTPKDRFNQEKVNDALKLVKNSVKYNRLK